MTRPAPWQAAQVCSMEKKPCCLRTRPRPWQVGQAIGLDRSRVDFRLAPERPRDVDAGFDLRRLGCSGAAGYADKAHGANRDHLPRYEPPRLHGGSFRGLSLGQPMQKILDLGKIEIDISISLRPDGVGAAA